MNREIWLSLDDKTKQKTMIDWLQQLYDIDHGSHTLTGKRDQGRLAQVKRDLEVLVLKPLEWEKLK